MKKFFLMVMALLFTTLTFAQKREKIKGSKTVTVAQKEVQPFESLEIEDNIEIFLVKGAAPGLEIEADDNLHDAIMAEVKGGNLRIYTAKEVSGAKKLSVRITYIDALNAITVKHETILNALTDLEVPSVTVKAIDYAKCYLNVRSGNFTFQMNDKTKGELNLRSDNATIELSKNAELKALIASPELKFDMYQKTVASIEGDTANAQLRIDNNAKFTGNKLTAKNMTLVAEGYTTCTVMATELINITATGKAEVQLFGTPKVEVGKFADSAVIYKKEQ
ncbi:GIN domain-containing protein [Flavobacterium sp.]|uniref:GIN domain-containing protein n=1 Tax=Flavobacterium sp. TaxID=239 RepID=UPI004033EAEE